MAAAVQQGTALKISFGSLSYPGYVPEDGVTLGRPARAHHVIADRTTGDTKTRIIVDKATTLSVAFVILDATGSITPPDEGDIITLTDPAALETIFLVLSAQTAFARGAARLRLSLIHEDSLTYA
jgi:hypothetical protein